MGCKPRGLSSSFWWGPVWLLRVPQEGAVIAVKPLPASGEVAEWLVGPQHLLPAPLSWTGRSREESWSHFRGWIKAWLGPDGGGGGGVASGLPRSHSPPQA